MPTNKRIRRIDVQYTALKSKQIPTKDELKAISLVENSERMVVRIDRLLGGAYIRLGTIPRNNDGNAQVIEWHNVSYSCL